MAELKIISMDEVAVEEVEWLWYPYIPYGKLTIIHGDGGEGKTTLILRLAALLSRGEKLPCDDTAREPIKIIYQTAEDGLGDTIKPRLLAGNADCAQIKVIDESEAALTMLDERVEKAIAETGARVIILDPMQAYIGAKVDMNRANEVRNILSQLGRIAEKYRCAIMALPVVDKEVRWSKRCKSPELVGTVKEVIHQVSHSKKWRSEKALDEDGNPILNSKGKQVYHASYSVLQDKFYEHMQSAGFNGFSRGERGSTAENLTSLEHKIKQDQKRLSDLQEKIADVQVRYDDKKTASMTFMEIDNSGKKSLTGKYTVSAEDYQKLTSLAKRSYSAESEVRKLQDQNRYLSRQIWSLQSEVSRLKEALSELTEKCRPYLEALKAAPKAVKEFIDGILERFKKQEKSIMYEPIPAPKTKPQERGQRSKNRNYER